MASAFKAIVGGLLSGVGQSLEDRVKVAREQRLLELKEQMDIRSQDREHGYRTAEIGDQDARAQARQDSADVFRAGESAGDRQFRLRSDAANADRDDKRANDTADRADKRATADRGADSGKVRGLITGDDGTPYTYDERGNFKAATVDGKPIKGANKADQDLISRLETANAEVSSHFDEETQTTIKTTKITPEGKKAIAAALRAHGKDDLAKDYEAPDAADGKQPFRGIINMATWGPDAGDSGDGVTKTAAAPTTSRAGTTARPQSQAEFNALPSGAMYINPSDGKTYRKK